MFNWIYIATKHNTTAEETEWIPKNRMYMGLKPESKKWTQNVGSLKLRFYCIKLKSTKTCLKYLQSCLCLLHSFHELFWTAWGSQLDGVNIGHSSECAGNPLILQWKKNFRSNLKITVGCCLPLTITSYKLHRPWKEHKFCIYLTQHVRIYSTSVISTVYLLTITVIPCSLQNIAMAERIMLSSNMTAWYTPQSRCNELQ
jgi:hypothetical protein